MFSHIMVGSNDLERSRRFYDALFATMGGKPGRQDDKGRLVYRHAGAAFMVSPPIDGQPATHANGGTIGFAVDGPEQGDAWHRAGVDHGGTPIEDAPGLRNGTFGPVWLGYLRDPDGNKLCAVHRPPAAA